MMLAYTPLLHPITALYPDLYRYWILLALPLLVAICLVYKGTRIANLADLPAAAGKMFVQCVLAIGALAVAVLLVYVVVARFF